MRRVTIALHDDPGQRLLDVAQIPRRQLHTCCAEVLLQGERCVRIDRPGQELLGQRAEWHEADVNKFLYRNNI
jgi:hypothetical protein